MSNVKELKKRIGAAFKALRKRAGYFVRQNWKCCQGCGCAAVPKDKPRYVFYHAQGNAEITEENPSVYLYWGGDDEVQQGMSREGILISLILEAEGLKVEWDGSASDAIKVTYVEDQSK